MSELFDIPESLSPRLRWLIKHKIHTFKSGNAEDFDGEPWSAWQAENKNDLPSDYETGATEDDAIAKWARQNGVKLWNETI